MEKKPLTIEEIRKSDPFTEGANLDLSGYPGLQNTGKADSSWFDPEFQRPIETNDPRLAFKTWLASPDGQATFARVAPEAAAQAEEDEALRAVEQFKAKARREGVPYFEHEKNFQQLGAMIDDSFNGEYTVDHLFKAWVGLMLSGHAIVDPEQPQLVGQEDKIRIGRTAAGGDMHSALGEYLRLRLPKKYSRALERADMAEYEDILAKPALQPIIREALLFSWFNGHPDVQETSELTRWFEEFTSKKLVITFATLDQAYDEFLAHKQHQQHAELFAPEPEPTREEVVAQTEEMDDEQVAKMLTDVRLAHAKERR